MKILQQILSLSLGFILLGGCGNKEPQAAEILDDSWIGIYVQELDDEMRDYMEIDEDYGILVNDVVDGSPADEAGVRATDVILKFDGKKIRSTEQLTRMVRETKIDEKVKVEIIRDKKKKNLELRIEERPEQYYSRKDNWKHGMPVVPNAPVHPKTFSFNFGRPKLGIKMSELNDELAEYFDVKADGGVLVLSVQKDSPAEKSGLKAGDVIQRFDDKRIRDEEDLLYELSRAKSNEEVELEIKRKGRDQKIKVTLDKSYGNSFRKFDKKDWEKFGRKMQEWGEDMKEWGHDFKWKVENDVDRIHIEIPLEEIGEELERTFETLGDELGTEMEHLARELENIHIEVDFDDGRRIL